MTPTLLIFTISAYIISLVLALILTFTSKKVDQKYFKLAAFIHLTLLVFTFLLFLIKKESEAYNYLFALSVCSALSLSGWAIRLKNQLVAVRIYFALTMLSVILFIISPSKLFYIASGNQGLIKEEQSFKLIDNYYLVEQQSMFQLNNESIKYKIILKLGAFNRTMAREIDLKGKIDSVHLISFTSDSVIIKAFNKNDSTESVIKTGMKEGTIIQKRNKQN